ncbi:tyrosine-type recombinase/integrase [Sphingomonas lenta]|uniref:tyrosine-type recombinase/integrase n=1 Tax=Sphingomonas lenta TaxID=1141887 RepID=UPI003CCC4509
MPTTLLVVRTDAVLPKRRSRRAGGDDAATPDARLLTVLGRVAPADLPPVSALGVETALEAMADASKLAIAADLDCWLDWCAGERRRACPADPEDLVRYLRALEADGKKPATLARRIASLATVHRLLGLDDALPTSAPMVRNALRGNRRRQGAAQRQAAPLRFGGGLGEAGGFTLSALLSACTGDVQGLRDAALLSLGYDAGLRVSELIAVSVTDLGPQPDGTGLLHLPRSKTDQEGIGAWAWLSADTMRRVAAWRAEGAIADGVLFRRVGVDRRRQRSKELADARWGDEDTEAAALLVTYTVGDAPLSRQGVTGIYRRIALAAFNAGLVELPAGDLEAAIAALSTHSLRVGLTQDLFAAGEDGAGIALTLRWSSPSTALRYGRRLQAQSGVAARVLSRVRT